MKKLLLITTPLLLAACTPNTPPALTPAPAQSNLANLPTETARQGQYIALPGQAAVDADAAFDQHAAAFNQAVAAPAPQPVTEPVAPTVATPGAAASLQQVLPPAVVQTPAPMQVTSIPTATGTAVVMAPTQAMPVQPVVSQPVPGYAAPVNAFNNQINNMAAGSAAIAGVAAGMVQPVDAAAMNGPIDYTLRITNATPGRVFVEAQDAAGEIYPCGFMTGSQSISSEKKQVAPIKGPITVVVRDPDKPDAPELRRYKVDPPTGYAGKTVEITIISGGLYQVSVDGQVRYITPTPVGKPDLGNAASTSPAEAAAAEAAKAAAEGAAAPATPEPGAPAPEQTPAGM